MTSSEYFFLHNILQISEEEALVYVETIKSYLEEAEKMAAEGSNDEEEKIREILLERKLEESAMQQKLEEEEEAKAEFMRSLINAEQTGMKQHFSNNRGKCNNLLQKMNQSSKSINSWSPH